MDHTLLEIDGGSIEGEILVNKHDGKQYYSYRGVPYAKTPVGSLRFRPPELPKKWEGLLQCKAYKDICMQTQFYPPHVFEGSEDCLYLNVFFPKEDRNTSRPVMVYFHGGGFTTGGGGSNFASPEFLVAKGVVVVTVNYRLNIFGFLNLGIEECPGNVGLLDQRRALTWVKYHIRKFGGDPGNVTIFGVSSGAASVHYHLLSPLSKGLFHKAILQSGCSLDEWAYMDPALSIERAFRIGKDLGCKSTDVHELHKFLLGVSAKTLNEAINTVLTPEEKEAGKNYPFVPSKEIVGAYEKRFLPDDPRNLLKNAPEVPIICGVTNSEGLHVYVEKPDQLPIDLEDEDSAFDNRFPEDLKRLSTDRKTIEKAKDKVKKFYMKGDYDDKVVANNIVDFYGDVTFLRGTYQMLKAYLSSPERKPIYLYVFDYESHASMDRLQGELPDYFKGACHGDDMRYLFHRKICGVPYTNGCMRLVENMTSLWTNFAKTGNPNGKMTVNWEPLSPDKISYCKINEELRIQPGFIYEERMKFWEDIYQSLSKQTQNGTS